MALPLLSATCPSLLHIGYPGVFRAAYALRRFVEPAYMNRECLLHMVNETAADHWEAHPLWRNFELTPHSCEQQTGMDPAQYFHYMMTTSATEHRILYGVLLVAAFAGLCYLISHRKQTSFARLSRDVVFALVFSSGFFLTTHYQNDLTHISGNVAHHTNLELDGANSTLVAGLPHGLIFSILLNLIALYPLAASVLARWNVDPYHFFAVSSIVFPLKQLYNMKIVHPYIHEHKQSVYPFPLDKIFKDYEGHVLCHHVNGYCLGDLPGVSQVYDGILYGHSQLYAKGILVDGTQTQKIFNVLVDYALLVLFTAVFSLCVALLMYTVGALFGWREGSKRTAARREKVA